MGKRKLEMKIIRMHNPCIYRTGASDGTMRHDILSQCYHKVLIGSGGLTKYIILEMFKIKVVSFSIGYRVEIKEHFSK